MFVDQIYHESKSNIRIHLEVALKKMYVIDHMEYLSLTQCKSFFFSFKSVQTTLMMENNPINSA